MRLIVLTVLIAVGILTLLASFPLLLLGGLGIAGIVADVSVEENREFGMVFLGYGIPMFLAGLAMVVAPLLAWNSQRSTKNRY